MKFSFSEDCWLSENLGKPAFRVSLSEDGGQLADLVGELPADSFCFIKIKPEEVEASAALSKAGFFLADTNVVLEMPFEALKDSQDLRVRQAVADDCEQVGRVAAESFTWTRFHQDPFISNDIADILKKQWAENFFKGQRGSHMIVAEVGNRVVGFNQILAGEDQMIIDLIGVSPDFQKQGLGQAMMTAMKEINPACKKIIVGTQMANAPSMRFYQRFGFEVARASNVFHRHGDKQ